MAKPTTAKPTRHDLLRKTAADSNKYLNATIRLCGGSDRERIAGKDRNTYATVADMNNIAVKGTMAHVIQLTHGVRHTRDDYTDDELKRIATLEILEGKALETYRPQGHEEIICLVAREIAKIDEILTKYDRANLHQRKRKQVVAKWRSLE
ncbi:hypothetical protein [Baaleninema simplex]|uniref:hypothetical protein n=1 Tax=Baaleninema simplex TaxID=2862350 RepID=UPI00034B896E|nr:hypothetical protein [Baaleninema simplex]